MRLSNLLSLAGFIVLIAGTFCPILHSIFGNWDIYEENKFYGIVILLVVVIGVLGTVLNQPKIAVTTAWFSLILVALCYLYVLLKIQTAVHHIPSRSLPQYLHSKIRFKWGWFLLFGGPVLALIGISTEKNKGFSRPVA